jgi:selenophosphate synthase
MMYDPQTSGGLLVAIAPEAAAAAVAAMSRAGVTAHPMGTIEDAKTGSTVAVTLR